MVVSVSWALVRQQRRNLLLEVVLVCPLLLRSETVLLLFGLIIALRVPCVVSAGAFRTGQFTLRISLYRDGPGPSLMQHPRLLQTSQDNAVYLFLNADDLLVQGASAIRKYTVRTVGRGCHGAIVARSRGVVVRGVRRVPPMVVTAGYHAVRPATLHDHASVLSVDPQRSRGAGVIGCHPVDLI